MGNTLIQDSATGNIMGLSPGFIPVGMKEHGGIMYIASVNKEGEGEIGTIPSPIIRDIYKDKVSIPFDSITIPVDTGDPIQITNKLYPADKFIANLQMTIDPDNLKGIRHTKRSDLSGQGDDPCDIVLERQICNAIASDNRVYSSSLYSPVISYSTNSEDNVQIDELEYPRFIRKKGIYKLNLYSSPEEGKSVTANENLLSSQVYGLNGENKSQYWFLHTNSPTTVFPKDLFNATLNKDLKQVPVSNKSGKLAIELIPESITDFGMLPREDELYVPITYKTNDGKYHTYFPGFYYTSDNGLYVEKLTARVIDESTNLEVGLVYPYSKEVLFDRFNLSGVTVTSFNGYTDPFRNGGLKLWDDAEQLGLPHQRSRQSSNTQILSPIAGLFDHTQTSFKSSTQDKDDSPHSGVFYADLGDKYQNWYRLEVDYEDQYGGNKGTFTTRFNPYINDVFGTNLSVDDVEYSPNLVMGKDNHTFTSKTGDLEPDDIVPWINYSMQGQECLIASNYYNYPKIYQKTGRGNFYSEPVTFYRKWNNETTIYDKKDGTITYKYKWKTQINNDPNSTYLYSELSYTDNITLSVDDFCIDSCCLGFGYENDDPNSKNFKKTNDTQKFGENQLELLIKSDKSKYTGKFIHTNLVSNNTWSLFTQLAFLFNNKQTQFSIDGQGTYDNDSVMHLTMNESTNGRYTETIPTPKLLSQDVSKTITFKLSDSASGFQTDGTYKAVVNVENWYEGSFYRLTYGYPDKGKDESLFDDADNQYYWTIGQEGCNNSLLNNFRVRVDVNYPNELEVIRTYDAVKAAYKITPYFLLKGVSDDGKQVYVQRFNGMTFQHNFVYENENAINYIDEQFVPEDETKKPCSYNEENPFYCKSDNFIWETPTLESGIYVLNVHRCPGVGNWTQSDQTPVVNLQIQINDNCYEFNPQGGEKTIKNWSIGAIDTNKYKYETSNGDTSNMRIYIPVVVVVPNNSTMTISINGVNNYKFNRQSIGMYKIKDVYQDDILNNLQLSESIYLYHDYMNVIENKAKKQQSEVEQYAFMQKYGVFFKEAFVFVDGLYQSSKVNPITVDGVSYQPYPYIPSDPSIFPVCLSSGTYSWNTYYMPQEVLTSGKKNCYFVFSNAEDLPDAVMRKLIRINDGQLRQLIIQE